MTKHLSECQEKMADHHEGPMLAVAVAGSGKTTAIIENLKRKYESGIDLTRVIVTAFSKDASTQLKERVQLFCPYSEHCPIGTSHSFFLRFQRRYGLSMNGLYREWDIKKAIRDILHPRYINEEDVAVFRAIGYLKNRLAYPEPIENTDCFKTYQSLRGPVAEACEVEVTDLDRAFLSYEHVKKSTESIDMDDMLFGAYVLLRQNKQALNDIQTNYTHLIIDEYQDTNEVQYQLFKIIAEKNRNIIVVGDDDQAIYSFRGSSPHYIQRFEKDYPDAKKVTMDLNYRSQSLVVSLANRVIGNNKQRFDKTSVSMRPTLSKPFLIHCEDRQDEANLIAEYIESSQSDMNKTAILIRLNMQQLLLEQALSQRGIPYAVADGSSFFLRKEIVTLISYLDICKNGIQNRMDLVRDLANKPYRKFRAEEINSWFSFNEFLNFCFREKRGMDYYDQLQYLENLEYGNSATEAIKAIIEDPIKLGSWLNHSAPLGEDVRPLKLLQHVLKMSENRTIDGIVEEIKGIQTFCGKMRKGRDKVTLCTIHRAKGLEWDEVYIPGLNENILPHEKTLDLEEERRLFYVAVTRSKKHLILTTRKNEAPSIFLDEIKDVIDVSQEEIDNDSHTTAARGRSEQTVTSR